jgi:copper(I)-binding protein
VLAGLLVGCSTSSTGTWLPDVQAGPVSATTAQVGSMTLRDLVIEDPRGGESYHEGESARMGLVLVNSGRQGDVLLEVTSPIARRTTIFTDSDPRMSEDPPTSARGLLALPAPGSEPTVVRAYVELEDLTSAIREGQSYPVTFRFASAGTVRVPVPVKVTKV